MKKAIYPIILMAISSCATVNTDAPFVDINLTNNYSTLKADVDPEGKMTGRLLTADGKFGAVDKIGAVLDSDGGNRDVKIMNLVPGDRKITAGCYIGSFSRGLRYISFEFTLNMKPNETYLLICSTNEEETEGKFEVVESHNKQKVELRDVKWLSK